MSFDVGVLAALDGEQRLQSLVAALHRGRCGRGRAKAKSNSFTAHNGIERKKEAAIHLLAYPCCPSNTTYYETHLTGHL